MITKYGTERKDQVSSDMNFGSWGEEVLVKWIEEYFNKRELFKITYWYNSDYEATRANLKGVSRLQKLKEYDLKFGEYYKDSVFPNREILFEIKTDKYEWTGNVAFEKADKGKASGVFVTASDYFIYFMPRFHKDNLFIIKSKNLKAMLSNEKWDQYIRMSGDIGMTANFIIPTDIFSEAFKMAGGKIETFNPIIPAKFNLNKIVEPKKTVYHGDNLNFKKDINFLEFN